LPDPGPTPEKKYPQNFFNTFTYCFTLNQTTMAKNFKPNVGGKISKKEAMEWIEKYDKELRKDKSKDTKSVFYGRDVLLKILSEEDSAGITFFFGLKYSEFAKKDTLHLVMVPTREDGTHIWKEDTTTSSPAASMSSGGEVAFDSGTLCPPYC